MSSRRDINDSELTTNVVCLANGDGGLLLIGVDNDGAVIGARPRHGKATEPERLPALVANTTSPPVNVTASTVDVGGKTVIVIEVPKQTSLVSTTSGVYVRRALDVNGDAQCLPMQPHDAIARLASIGQRDLSAMPVPDATSDDLDEIEIGRFRESVRTIGDRTLAELSTDDLISALGFRTVDGDLVVGAVLMFGTEQALRRFVPTHEVAFQVLDQSSGVQANRIQRIPLVRAMTELSSAIAPSTDGITIHNLLSVPPKPRNPLLADAFKRAGLVERTGRGINRVFAGQLELGRPAPDYSRSTNDRVEVRMRSGPADQELAAFIASVRSRNAGMVDLRFLQVLHEVRQERRITSTEQPRCSKFPSMRRGPNSTS
ncbi:MAG: putative DNA binding domain-containing protein [Candidatus Microthrix sp.]|nr:putative DNA binding domain-containing protein [Candidatus Microthrix sp.]